MKAYGIGKGRPEPNGATLDADGVNFAVWSAHAEAIAVCLFDEADKEVARLRLPSRTGDTFHGHIAGLGAGTRYGLRAFGPWDPERGHRFNPGKLLVDPYAIQLDRRFQLHSNLFDRTLPSPADTAPLVPKAVVAAPADAWLADPCRIGVARDRAAVALPGQHSPCRGAPFTSPREDAARTPDALPSGAGRDSAAAASWAFDWEHQVIYELHVRGFTVQHPDIPAPLRGRFAGLGHPAAIAHLTRLGITTVELMPCAAWIDERHLPPLGLSNYWGYNPMALLAPDPRLAPDGWAEISGTVAALHAAGIAVVLDVVLNHTGESDHLGPTVSLRGLDNASYYRLLPDAPDRYINDAGCGNVLALDRPPVLALALAALRAWVRFGGIDGFRLDLAATLGRRAEGFDPAAPLLAAMQQDPILAGRVIIAEPWDIGTGGYQLGNFPDGWGEWNDRFRDTVRRFWRGDHGMLADMATRFAGSADVFAARHRPLSRSVNYITAHDGFTLADLVSHTQKRNAANGERNRDGADDNYGWNNGAEGETGDPAIQAARRRDMRALLAILLLARGTPMLSMGDEGGRTQRGNNNAYAQDNPISWMDWASLDQDLIGYTANLVRLRLASPALANEQALIGAPVDDSLIPDVDWRMPDGNPLSPADWHDRDRLSLVAVLYAKGERVAVLLHAGAACINVVLPEPRAGMVWCTVIDSAGAAAGSPPPQDSRLGESSLGEARAAGNGDGFTVRPRSVVLLRETRSTSPRPRAGTSDEALGALALAAGIAPVWWDVDGRETRIAPTTQRSLLAAMRLPADSPADIRDSLERIKARDRTVLPMTYVARAGAARTGTPIGVPVRQGGSGAWLTLVREDGTVSRHLIPDGAVSVQLPPLPHGRHRLLVDDRPECACHLIVVPPRCHLPEALAGGVRRFGIAAHLYTLRRPGDQGIGDFTTLTELAAEAARAGAAIIGLNPLHALFASDRERTSPYHPSDRRFLDPIYLDVPEAAGAASESGMVDYPAVWRAKRRALEIRFERDGTSDPDFAAFLEAGGDPLRQFATFEALAEALGSTAWRDWPPGLRHPRDTGIDEFAARHDPAIRFSCFLQYLADRQLGRAAEAAANAGLGLGFYRDLAVGAAPDGAEAWGRQDALMTGVSVGAPPDPFAAQGQVWCLPPPDPLAMAREGYAGFGDLLSVNMRHAGALRIDHVMALRRLFLVPDGASAADGAYISYPFDDLLGVTALESHRARCMVVGEALGTVPEGMPRALADANVLSYSVLWFERDGASIRAPGQWPMLAAACVSTHDLPTLAGWWAGADITEHAALGLMDRDAERIARAGREREKASLIAMLVEQRLLGQPYEGGDETLSPAVAAAVHALIARTPALLTLVQADDLAGELIGVNLPGTDRERPNWRRRLGRTVAGLFHDPLAAAILAASVRR